MEYKRYKNKDEKGKEYVTIPICLGIKYYGYQEIFIQPKSKWEQLVCRHHFQEYSVQKENQKFLSLNVVLTEVCLKCGKTHGTRVINTD